MVELFSHQKSNSEWLLDVLKKTGAALDGSDTGTGKSLTALQLCKMVGARPLIVSRKTILHSWKDSCDLIGITPEAIVNYEHLRTNGCAYGKVVETIRGENKVSHYEWNQNLGKIVIIYDEAQACRSAKSIQSKSLIKAAERYKTLIVSATPFGSPLEAFPIGSALKLFNNKTYFRWMLARGVRKNPFGHYSFIGDMQPDKGEVFLKMIHEELYPSRGCRTRRQDIPGFPETLIDVLSLETGNGDEITAIYEKLLAASIEADYEKLRIGLPEELHDLAEPLAITQNLRLRQKAELLKCAAMAERAMDAADKGESVALFVNFDHSIEALMKYLKTDCTVRGSGEDGHTRFKNIQAFQNNKARFIIINCAAGGCGVSLHDPVHKKPRTSFISPPQSATLLKQILGRPHRAGGGYSTQFLCFAHGTVEEQVMIRVRNKVSNIDTIQDSDLELTRSVTA